MNQLNRRVFSFSGQELIVDLEWLPHIRVSSDKGQSWESGTDIEFLTEKLGLGLNRTDVVRAAFQSWCDQNPPIR